MKIEDIENSKKSALSENADSHVDNTPVLLYLQKRYQDDFKLVDFSADDWDTEYYTHEVKHKSGKVSQYETNNEEANLFMYSGSGKYRTIHGDNLVSDVVTNDIVWFLDSMDK